MVEVVGHNDICSDCCINNGVFLYVSIARMIDITSSIIIIVFSLSFCFRFWVIAVLLMKPMYKM